MSAGVGQPLLPCAGTCRAIQPLFPSAYLAPVLALPSLRGLSMRGLSSGPLVVTLPPACPACCLRRRLAWPRVLRFTCILPAHTPSQLLTLHHLALQHPAGEACGPQTITALPLPFNSLLIVGFVGRWRQRPQWIMPPTHHSCCSAALARNTPRRFGANGHCTQHACNIFQ